MTKKVVQTGNFIVYQTFLGRKQNHRLRRLALTRPNATASSGSHGKHVFILLSTNEGRKPFEYRTKFMEYLFFFIKQELIAINMIADDIFFLPFFLVICDRCYTNISPLNSKKVTLISCKYKVNKKTVIYVTRFTYYTFILPTILLYYGIDWQPSTTTRRNVISDEQREPYFQVCNEQVECPSLSFYFLCSHKSITLQSLYSVPIP